MKRYLVFDYEAYSEADLKLVGGWEYSVHPSTEVMCVAWQLGTREELRAGVPTQAYCHMLPDNPDYAYSDYSEFIEALHDRDVTLVAHNAGFEYCITENVLSREYPGLKGIPHERYVCTASLAAAKSLPRKLEKVCLALGLKAKKDMTGHRLMLKMAKPRKPSKNNPATRHTKPEELAKLTDYCADDITAEVELFLKLPPLNKTERKVWCLDQKINYRGFAVDRKTVNAAIHVMERENTRLLSLVEKISGGEITSTRQRDATLHWLSRQGFMLPNLRAATVEEAITGGLVAGEAKKLLQIRQSLSKTSTAKFYAFESRSRSDSRLRDNLMYHGAGTGRWSGVGVQPQNFPRLKFTEQMIDLIKEGDVSWFRYCYGDVLTALSCCLRGMIVAPKGKVLDIADYASIEARVLFWLAGHTKGVEAFRNGGKLYEELAAVIFNMLVEEVGKEGIERFIGKQATLGCGYQMGWAKFMATCANLGHEISAELAKLAVSAYRKTHAPVVRLWSNYQKAAIAAVKNPGKQYTINRVTWYVSNDFLIAKLPSGRKLSYYKPAVVWEKPHWGGEDKIEVLRYWGEDSVTRQWVPQKTYGGKLAENISQAVSRDFMAEAMLRIENAGPWDIVLTVHDELVAERDKSSSATNADFCELMAELPTWGDNCPIAVEGFETMRYRK